jgi:hypothetical protein
MTVVGDWHRALMALYPPGSFSRDPASLHGILAEADAKVLFAGAQVVEQLEKEIFPSTAEQTLTEWERVFRSPPAPGSTTAQRQAAISARWRSAMPFTLEGARTIAADLLMPEYYWRDAFENGIIDWRYTQDLNACTLVEVGGATPYQRIAVATAADARWDATHKLQGMSTIPLIVERGAVTPDDFWFCARVDMNSINDGMGGVLLWQDDQNALGVGLQTVGASVKIRRWSIIDNVVATLDSGVAEPTAPYWITIGRIAGVVHAYVGTTLPSPFEGDALTTHLGTIPAPTVHPTRCGIFLFNDGTTSQQMSFGEIRQAYRMRQHNVQIIENCLATLTGASDTNRFFCFVKRPLTDFGAGDLKRAQIELDRFKPAHIQFTVGETSYFLADDAHCLTDRDVCGL